MVLPSEGAPLSRHRCLYLGAAPPSTGTGSDPLAALQAPLLSTLPDDLSTITGVDSWLTVLAEGIHVSYIDDTDVFYPISNLFTCAAVRRTSASAIDGRPRFVALESSTALDKSSSPPVFAAILRRPTDHKIIECHMFVCKTSIAALSLVQAATFAFQSKPRSDSRTDQALRRPMHVPVVPTAALPALPAATLSQPALDAAVARGRILPPIWSGTKPPGAENLSQEQINEMVRRALQSQSGAPQFLPPLAIGGPKQLPGGIQEIPLLKSSGGVIETNNPVFEDYPTNDRKEVEIAAFASELFRDRRDVPKSGGTVTGDLEKSLGYLP